MYDRPTALTAATLLAVSPLFWFYGTVGLTYAGEALFASLVAYFAFRALRAASRRLARRRVPGAGRRSSAITSSCFSFPLWLISVVARAAAPARSSSRACDPPPRRLAWFLPMIWLTGGLERYIDASRRPRRYGRKPTSILGGPLEVTLRMSRYLLESVLVALGPLAVVVLLVPWYVRRHGWGRASGSCSRGRCRRCSSTRSCTSGRPATC